MALDVGGRHAEAARARTSGCADMQHADGGWHAYYLGDDVKDPTLDTNVTCYVATGVWHHYLATGDTAFLERALADGRSARSTSRSTTSTRPARSRGRGRRSRRRRAAHRIVEHPPQPALRDRDRRAPRPRTSRLGAVARRARHRDRAPARALPRQGALGDGLVLPDPRRRAARPRRRTRASRRGWDDVRRSRAAGVRCVSDQPWITAAETCELVMALDAIGVARARARSCSRGCSSCATTTAATGPARTSTTTRFDRRRRALPRRAAHVELRGGRARRQRARRRRARPPACSAARASPRASPPTSCIAAGVEIERDERADYPPPN